MRKQRLNKNTRNTPYNNSLNETINSLNETSNSLNETRRIIQCFTDIYGNFCRYDDIDKNGCRWYYYMINSNTTMSFRFDSKLVDNNKPIYYSQL